VAEVTEERVGDHAEPPARTANRRRLYEERLAAARHPLVVLRVLAGYIQGSFSRHSLEDVKEISNRLADATDEERRRHCGSRDDD
jgi:hypothetical protein